MEAGITLLAVSARCRFPTQSAQIRSVSIAIVAKSAEIESPSKLSANPFPNRHYVDVDTLSTCVYNVFAHSRTLADTKGQRGRLSVCPG